MYGEKNKAIRISLKYSNSLEIFPHAVQKNFAMHESDFKCKCAVKRLNYRCELVSEEVDFWIYKTVRLKPKRYIISTSEYPYRNSPIFLPFYHLLAH